MATTPTAAEIDQWSKVEFADLEWEEADLEREIERAQEYVLDVTGYATPEDVPANYSQTYREAIQRRVEQQAYATSPDIIETVADFDLIKSFSAGSYSETRRDAEDAMKAKMINAWPLLNDLLMRMLTPDKYDFWLERWGQRPPAFEMTEVDWGAGDDYGIGSLLHDPGA